MTRPSLTACRTRMAFMYATLDQPDQSLVWHTLGVFWGELTPHHTSQEFKTHEGRPAFVFPISCRLRTRLPKELLEIHANFAIRTQDGQMMSLLTHPFVHPTWMQTTFVIHRKI